MIILLYHNVLAHRPSAFNMLARPDWLSIDDFAAEIESVAERFDIVPLDDIVEAVRCGKRIPRACAITFDDGYAGAYEHAASILGAKRLTAAYFVVTENVRDGGPAAHDYFDRLEAMVHLTGASSVDLSESGCGVSGLTCDECKLGFLRDLRKRIGSMPWADAERLLETLDAQLGVAPDRIGAYLGHDAFRMMSWSQLDDLSKNGHAVGSHTRTHRTLSRLDDAGVASEVSGSYADLRARLGDGPLPFAYPLGKPEHFGDVTAEVERAGFSCALTTVKGMNDAETDPYQLRRVVYRDLKKLRDAR